MSPDSAHSSGDPAVGSGGSGRDPARASGEAAVVVEGVTKRFGTVAAVQDLSLRVPRGAFVSLLGPSGCGKTTLLRMVGGFERQEEGSIWVHGECVDARPPNKRNVNMVFQRYALFPHKTVEQNIEFPLGIAGVPKDARRERVEEMLELTRLPDVAKRKPSEISGGQAQRVALARALVGRPDVLLLDEPLAALDRKLRQRMQIELRRIQETVGTTFLFVTHDQEEALAMSDLIVLMDAGRIVQTGTARELYEQPRNAFASDFIGETNLLPGTVTHIDDTTTLVDRPEGPIHAPPADDVAPGDRVSVSVRPEHVRMSLPGTGPDGPDSDNTLTGTVDRTVFAGNFMRVLVAVDEGLVVTAECSPHEGRRFDVGSTVNLSWSAERCTIVPS